jgi:2-keto-3-deoxy-L-rhamnonate aldolase RhmA
MLSLSPLLDLILEKIMDKGYSIGTWITISSPEISEAICLLNFDWAVIDMEHSPLDFIDTENLLIGLNCGEPIVGIIRIPLNDPVYVKRALDIGSHGILAPLISSREDAESFVRYATYPPKGIRGVGPRRASRYGLISLDKYMRYSENLLLLIQIETREALENLDDILDVEEIKGVFVGPSDLAANLGVERSFRNPELKRRLEEIVEKASRKKRIIGIMTYTPDEALKAIDMGYNFIALGSDIQALINGFKTFIESLKKEIR